VAKPASGPPNPPWRADDDADDGLIIARAVKTIGRRRGAAQIPIGKVGVPLDDSAAGIRHVPKLP
jgi:hypothetical protein